MEIRLFKLNKRNNSTKRPSGSGDSFNCYLKDSTSVVDPAVIMEYSSHTSYYDYNYAYIPDFKRYYFISDIISSGKTWELTLMTDVLATYKDTIGSSSMYVLRSAAAWDGRIIDTYYPVMPVYKYESDYMPSFGQWVDNIDLGCFVLGIVGCEDDNKNIGSLRYYVMNRSSLYKLTEALLDSINNNPEFSFEDLTIGLQKALVDPLNFIKSCVWLPYSIISVADSIFGSYSVTLNVNGWVLGSEEDPIPNYMVKTSPPYVDAEVAFQIRRHPWTASRGKYLNCSPYTKATLNFPPFGTFDLDTTVLSDSEALRIVFNTDVTNGTGILEVYADNALLQRTSSQIGVPIQLNQAKTDFLNSMMGIGSGIVGSIVSAGTGNLFGAFSGIANTIGSAADMMKPTVSSTGGSGGFVDLAGGITLQYIFYYPVDEDLQNAGRPLCEVRTLSTLPGYQLIMDGDVQISGTAGEQAAVKTFLEGGYFYE